MTCAVLFCLPCFSKDLYVAQNAAGSNTGTSCSNAYGVVFFNSSANWGSGPAQISPGDAVHLCGTFTGAANSTMLTIAGSGAPGNPVTIVFESGARLTAPYWDKAVYCAGRSHIRIDGGTNGLITTTANGQNLANRRDSVGIELSGCSDIEIANLTIGPLYIRTPGSTDNCGCGTGIRASTSGGGNFAGSNSNFHDNTIFDAEYGIFHAYSTTPSDNVAISGNTISRTATAIVFGDERPSARASNIRIFGNDISDNYYWGSPNNLDLFHCDGIHTWATNSGSVTTNMEVYNNYIHGDMGNKTSGFIYLSAAGGSNNGARIYNNVLASTNSTGTDGDIFIAYNMNDTRIYNNTIIGPAGATGNAIAVQTYSSNTVIHNNVIAGFRTGVYVDGTSTISASNNNSVQCTGNAGACMIYRDGWMNWSQWQALGFDRNSLGPTMDPLLAADYKPLATSPVAAMGVNLTSLNIDGLKFDRAGIPRPASGAWDLGAHSLGAPAPAPAPPTALTATVQ